MSGPTPEQTKSDKRTNSEQGSKPGDAPQLPHPDGNNAAAKEGVASLAKFNEAKSIKVNLGPFDGDKPLQILGTDKGPTQEQKDSQRKQLTKELDELKEKGETPALAAKHAQLAYLHLSGNPLPSDKSQADYHYREAIRIGEATKADPIMLIRAYKHTAQARLEGNSSYENARASGKYIDKALELEREIYGNSAENC